MTLRAPCRGPPLHLILVVSSSASPGPLGGGWGSQKGCTPRAIVVHVALATTRYANDFWTLPLFVGPAALLADQRATWLCPGPVLNQIPVSVLVMSLGTIFSIIAVKLLNYHAIPQSLISRIHSNKKAPSCLRVCT